MRISATFSRKIRNAADVPRIEAAGLYLDYSKNRITGETLSLLIQLAEQSGLRERIEAMFRGKKINVTENRERFCTLPCALQKERPL